MTDENKRKHRFFAKLVKGKTLDVGYAQSPNPYLKSCIGLDVQRAPTPKNYTRTVRCNLNTETMPFKDASFASVILGDVIEHVENPSALLRDVNRCLKRGGILLVSTPHADHFWSFIDNWFLLRLIPDPDKGEHLSNWTKRDFLRLLKKNGFEVIRVYGTEWVVPIVHWQIPTRWSHILSWGLIYECRKLIAPDGAITTRKRTAKGLEWVRVKEKN